MCRSRAAFGSWPVTKEYANSRRAIGNDGGKLESENGVSSMREKRKARFVANISCDVIILRLCVARCDLVSGIITPAEGKANLSAACVVKTMGPWALEPRSDNA